MISKRRIGKKPAAAEAERRVVKSHQPLNVCLFDGKPDGSAGNYAVYTFGIIRDNEHSSEVPALGTRQSPGLK